MGRFLPLLLLCLALPLAAAAQTVSVNTGGGNVRIALGEAAVLPDDFPQDVALPRPHAIVQVRRSEAATTVEADVPGNVEAVLEAMRARMEADGWHAARMAQPPIGRASAWEKDRRAVVAWVQPAADGVRLQLQLLPRR